ncbi:MAG: phosphate signaling complex protein PhoU, partial [Verrucomicrobiota bacterium]
QFRHHSVTHGCHTAMDELHRRSNKNPFGAARLNLDSHIEESLRRDMDLIRAKVRAMAGLSERALQASLQALVQQNRTLAYGVILRDRNIDELETELNRLCLEFLVRHQPVASHLRFVFTAIQINKEVERIGDYAESVARQALVVSGLEPQPPYALFIELGELSVRMLREAVQGFLQADADLALRAMAMEEQANALRNSINAQLLELSRKNQLPAAALTPLMTVARRFERASDQAKNLCEEVLYMCTGEFAKHRGTDTFRVLFFDLNNACLSQMAEAIGNSMRPPRFEFSSAGVATQSLDARAVEFMAGKGIDISRQASKPLEQGAALGAVPGGGRAGGTGAQGVSYPARQDRHLYLVGQGPGERRGAGRRCTSRIRIGLREP